VRTQVGILGAGPAGLLLSHLLWRFGIDSVVLERRAREYVESRVRAGVLEHGAAELLRESGVGERMDRQGLLHDGISLNFEGARHRVDFRSLVGRGIVVYGQQEVVKDLIAARLDAGGQILFDAEAIGVEGLDRDRPCIRFRRDGAEATLECDFVAGCDGSHGAGRLAIPPECRTVFERVYGHAWLGVLAATPPASEELIYAYHDHGFALHSMRSPQLSRLYLQVDAGEDLRSWPEERIWSELRLRLGEPSPDPGEILELGITPMRSQVTEPMQYRRLFLAGDAAHIVPPTGAKGMNLALADVRELASALRRWYADGSPLDLDGYSGRCLERVWRAEYFSSFMTEMLHRDRDGEPFAHKLRLATLRYVVSSSRAAASLAENYTSAATGLPRG
jgi:p-hydroxybenzoate 3-monooxygenase